MIIGLSDKRTEQSAELRARVSWLCEICKSYQGFSKTRADILQNLTVHVLSEQEASDAAEHITGQQAGQLQTPGTTVVLMYFLMCLLNFYCLKIELTPTWSRAHGRCPPEWQKAHPP